MPTHQTPALGSRWNLALPRRMVNVTVNYMASKKPARKRAPVQLAPGTGREYAMGPLRAVFKADGAETLGRYSISEWWLEPRTKGPGAHSHDEDDVFYVLEGTMSFRVGDDWFDAHKGAFVIAPGGVPHDFENRTRRRAGMLNVSVPGDFEDHMPGIADWFRARPRRDSTTTEPAAPRARATPRPARRSRARASSRSSAVRSSHRDQVMPITAAAASRRSSLPGPSVSWRDRA